MDAPLWRSCKVCSTVRYENISFHRSDSHTFHGFHLTLFFRLYANKGNESLNSILHRLHHSTVAIVGLGGVGSWAAEALCRSGVGNLILIDLDDICISNTNRQLHALTSTVGQMKIDEMKRRLLDINPGCNVTLM